MLGYRVTDMLDAGRRGLVLTDTWVTECPHFHQPQFRGQAPDGGPWGYVSGMLRRGLPCLLLIACDGAGVTVDGDGDAGARPVTEWAGSVVDGGFGSRLAAGADTVYASAPFAARVYRLDDAGPVEVSAGTTGSFFGAGLAMQHGVLLVGEPVPGRVWADGKVVAEEAGLGGVVAARQRGWVASTATGWLAADGTRGALGRRPDALVDDQGVIVAGAAFGEFSIWRADVPGMRLAPGDEAGFALVRCDVDGDGVWEVVVGAPGRGVLLVGEAAYGTGTGRFGAALACGTSPGVLYVGAPSEGTLHAGAVFRLARLGEPELLRAGDPLDELGTALAVSEGRVYIGAPGPAAGAGRVVALPER